MGQENFWIIDYSDMHCPTFLKFGRLVHYVSAEAGVIKAENDWRDGQSQVAMQH